MFYVGWASGEILLYRPPLTNISDMNNEVNFAVKYLFPPAESLDLDSQTSFLLRLTSSSLQLPTAQKIQQT